MGILCQQLWDRYISESLARSDNQNDIIESRLAKLAIESLVAELNAATPSSERRILEVRDEVAQLRDVLWKCPRHFKICSLSLP